MLSVSDWAIIMIGPDGLLLVVPDLYALPVSVFWVGCKTINNQTWMWKIFLQGHTYSEHLHPKTVNNSFIVE
jgi:hypothetical protein